MTIRLQIQITLGKLETKQDKKGMALEISSYKLVKNADTIINTTLYKGQIGHKYEKHR